MQEWSSADPDMRVARSPWPARALVARVQQAQSRTTLKRRIR